MSEVLYLVEAQCPNCTAIVRAVEQYDEPVALDMDVPLSFSHCPKCGIEIGAAGGWDPREEAEIERVPPTQERGAT